MVTEEGAVNPRRTLSPCTATTVTVTPHSGNTIDSPTLRLKTSITTNLLAMMTNCFSIQAPCHSDAGLGRGAALALALPATRRAHEPADLGKTLRCHLDRFVAFTLKLAFDKNVPGALAPGLVALEKVPGQTVADQHRRCQERRPKLPAGIA